MGGGGVPYIYIYIYVSRLPIFVPRGAQLAVDLLEQLAVGLRDARPLGVEDVLLPLQSLSSGPDFLLWVGVGLRV